MKNILNKINFVILLFLANINSVFASETPLGNIDGIGNFSIDAKGGVGDAVPGNILANILTLVIGFLTILSGLYFLVFFIIGAINWISSGGDANKVEEARKKLTNAAIGLTIVIASYSVTYIVSEVLGLPILRIGDVITNLKP